MTSILSIAEEIAQLVRANAPPHLERPVFETFDDALLWLRSDATCLGIRWGEGDEGLRRTAKRLLFQRVRHRAAYRQRGGS